MPLGEIEAGVGNSHPKVGILSGALLSIAVCLFRDALRLTTSRTLLFPGDDNASEPIKKVVMPNAQRNLFRTALLNMEPAHVHDLRRTAATGMRRIGVHPHVVSLVYANAPPSGR
jgi:hypothetical protein